MTCPKTCRMTCRAMVACLVVLLAHLLPAPASAQAYPARPIRVIVSTSPGGISDVFVRSLAEPLHKRFGRLPVPLCLLDFPLVQRTLKDHQIPHNGDLCVQE